MKKTILGIFALMLSSSAFADPIDLAQARQIASQLGLAETQVSLVTNNQVAAARIKHAPLGEQSTLPYYIFSRGQGKGFVIVSGDDCLPQILGYTESGDYDEANMPPALKEWLAKYATLVEEAQASGQNTPLSVREAQARVVATERHDIPALVQTHWHQESPYNDLCPYMKSGSSRAMTGCVATAASQVVYYFHKDLPSTLQANTPTYGYGAAPVTESFKMGTPLKWGLMKASYAGSEPTAFKESVATFVAALGAATWLTYGQSDTDRSTSGQISNLVNTFNSCFNLSSVCKYKSGVSQAAWEQLIYDDLVAGRPIVYSGVHPTSGGHAVVLDGYQASTNLFHFNFGWGGQADGWYTVNDQTGMNGFSGQQGMVYNVQPKSQNIQATILAESTAFKSRVNSLKVKVANDGTVDFSNLYLFSNTRKDLPKNLTSAVGKDVETVVGAGESRSLSFEYTPKTVGLNYLTLTDKNLRVLAQDSVTVVDKACQLTLNSMRINGSSDREVAEGKSYTVVYNSAAVCEMEVANPTDVNFNSNYVTVNVDCSTDGGKTFENIGKARAKLVVDAGKTATTTALISNSATLPIVEGNYYRVSLGESVSSVNQEDAISTENGMGEVYFVVKPVTLEAACNEEKVCVFTGDWDERKFSTLVARSANAKAVAYDLTAVRNVERVPEVSKPNALIYVADNKNITGYNVVDVNTNSCKQLRLVAGNDFCPKKTLAVGHLELNINQEPNQWNLLTVPATVSVPEGMMARSISGHSISGIAGKTTNVQELEAGKTYLVKTATADNLVLTSDDCEVAVEPIDNEDANMKGSYAATEIEGEAYLLNVESGYFEKAADGAVTEGLRGYFKKDNTITASQFACSSRTLVDEEYNVLGETIASCLDLLEDNKDIVKEEAYLSFAKTIADVQENYTLQSMETKIQVANSIKALNAAAEAYKLQLKEGVSRISVDFTSAINNPSFERGNMLGWNAKSSVKSVKMTNSYIYTGVGAEGDYLAYCTAKAESTTGISQEVKGLLPGTYTLKAMLGTKDDYTVTMYAGDKEVSVGAHPFGEYYLSEASIEGIEVGEDSTLTIGIRPCLWFKADNFRLTCIATSGVVNAIQGVVANHADDAVSVRMEGNTVFVTTASRQPVAVYNMYGMCVWRQTVDGTVGISLPKGIYVVGKKKLMVK